MSEQMFQNLLRGLVSLTVVAGLGLGSPSPVLAQDEEEGPPPGWSTGLNGGIGFTQSEFENYAEGGESSLTYTTLLTFTALQNLPGREWKTLAELQYGQTKLGEQEFRKAVDRIKMESINIWKTGGFVNPYVSVDARTQIDKSFEYDEQERVAEISRFANPLYFNQGAGVGTWITPHLTTRLGLGLHEVFVTKDIATEEGARFAATFTDDPETAELEKSRFEAGSESITEYEREFPEQKLNVKSTLRLFSAFDDPAAVDVTWNSKFTANLFSIFNVILEAEVLYDENIVKRTQFKEVLSLGVSHKFF